METREYRTVDKSDWIRGEWDNEPDKMQFADPATGLPCLIVRNNSGALCGYVGVVDGHPLFGKDYEHTGDIEVHGGLTFADFCADTQDESKFICHVPAPGEPNHVWWLGFDCAHSGDLCPEYASKYGRPFDNGFESYKSIAYVKNQCARLAAQLAAAP